MATKTEPAKQPDKTVNEGAINEVRLKHLKAREKSIQDKIANRIPKFPKKDQAAALERAEKHLDDIRKEIKAAS